MGAFLLFAMPSFAQLPGKSFLTAFPKWRTQTPSGVKNILAKSPFAAALPAGISLPAASILPVQPQNIQLFPLAAPNTAAIQVLLRKTLAKPADDFYGFFKQLVYAHQNSSSVVKKMDQNYFEDVNALLQQAAYITWQKGYDDLAQYLKKYKGQMPSLSPKGTLQTSEHAAKLLTFFASEEMGSLLENLLARPAAKQDPTENEWFTMNVLSLMLPEKTRTIFYNLLLEKQYSALYALARDPYLTTPFAQALARGEMPQTEANLPSLEQRLQQRKARLQQIFLQETKQKQALDALQKEYTQTKVQYDILTANHQSEQARALEQKLASIQRNFIQKYNQFQALTQEVFQLRVEVAFLQTK